MRLRPGAGARFGLGLTPTLCGLQDYTLLFHHLDQLAGSVGSSVYFTGSN